jgi:transglutaminase-like putative cysteine protease
LQFFLAGMAGFRIDSARMKWEIHHRTLFTYASPVRDSFNDARLQPFSSEEQTVESFDLKVLPSARLSQHHDFYSNIVHHFEIAEPHTSLLVESNLRVATHPLAPLPGAQAMWELSRIQEALKDPRTHEFLEASRYVDISPETWRLAVDATIGQTDAWLAALALMRFVHEHLDYVPNSTTVNTPMRRALAERHGVCQDFAHVMIGLCRALKIPALYVSGYLATEKASATHAWTEVFIPGAVWRALDPTHNCQPGETYVKTAVGRDYADVPPIAGNYKGTTDRKMEVEVEITPV